MSKPSRKLDLSQCRVTLIANPKAGKKDADDCIAMIKQRLEPVVQTLVVCPIHQGGKIHETARAAVEEGSDVIVALGGDGTQSAVAGALAGTRAVMAVLPGGTFNYFARELEIESMDKALEALINAHVRTRHLGAINDRIFINNASFGLYPRILERREVIYRSWGRSRLAAYWSVLIALRDLDNPMHLSVTDGGAPRDFYTPLAFVARSAFQLEQLGLDGAEAVREGHFALFIARGRSRQALFGAAWRLAFGRVAQGEDFDLVVSDELLVETSTAQKLVALDGEKERMSSPFRLRVLRDALQIIAPAEPMDDGAQGNASA